MRQIKIDPITRLEGHGKIDIFLNDDGEVANTYFQIPELRGFEQFCVGRPVEEMRPASVVYVLKRITWHRQKHAMRYFMLNLRLQEEN
jgi:coenzyme F420-reducing hydrogenase alpha subunit